MGVCVGQVGLMMVEGKLHTIDYLETNMTPAKSAYTSLDCTFPNDARRFSSAAYYVAADYEAAYYLAAFYVTAQCVAVFRVCTILRARTKA